jgi:hypothetical protein
MPKDMMLFTHTRIHRSVSIEAEDALCYEKALVTVRRTTFLATLVSARSIHSSSPSPLVEVRISNNPAALV